MKKFILVILAITVICTLTACGNESDGTTTTAASTAPSTTAYVLYDESTVKENLSYYNTGLSADIYDYTFKITPTSYYGREGVKAEAYLGDAKTPEAIFMLIQSDCFVFSKEYNKYLYLTVNGAIDITPTTDSAGNATTQSKQEQIDEQNTSVLANRYKGYDLSVVNLDKAITEYDFQVTGIAVTTSDGVTVYKVYVLYEGVYVDAVFGVGSDGKDYYYDSANDTFKQLKAK